nr:MAG TPA: hypothetical protein [Caudoviricetes sp.]
MLVPFGDHFLGNRQNSLTYATARQHPPNPLGANLRKLSNAGSIPTPETVPNGLQPFFSVFRACIHFFCILL